MQPACLEYREDFSKAVFVEGIAEDKHDIMPTELDVYKTLEQVWVFVWF